MSWEVKHRGEFTDIEGLNWKVDIEQDDYAGSILPLHFSGEPLFFDFLNKSDDVFDPIRGTKVDFTIYSETDFQYQDLYAIDDLQYRVRIYANETLYYIGYIITGNYTEPYEGDSYPVTISCACGLGILKNFEYKDNGEYYNGHKLESQIILDILDKIGFTEFKEFVNLYDAGMNKTVDDSPFDQSSINVDIFKDSTCYEVLSHLVSKKNAFIRQKNGIFEIIRPKELLDAIVYGRYFTGASTKTSVTFNPDQYIKRVATHPSKTTLQVPGGHLMIQGPTSKVISRQDYGYKDSLIDNWELKGNTYNEDTGSWDNWTNSKNLDDFPSINSLVPNEEDGCFLLSASLGEERTAYICQSFGTYLQATEDVINFSIDYMFYSWFDGEINGVDTYIKIMSADGTRSLKIKDENELEWATGSNYIHISTGSVSKGKSGWLNFSRRIAGLPLNFAYVIFLYNSSSFLMGGEMFATGFKNVKFYCTSDSIVKKKKKIVGGLKFIWKAAYALGMTKEAYRVYTDIEEIVEKEYTKDNSINGAIEEREYLLGDVTDSDIDNVSEQFAGAMMRATASQRRDWILLVGTIAGLASMSITCNGITKTCTYNTSLEQTAADFVTNHAAAYNAVGITVTSFGWYIWFIGSFDFSGETYCSNHVGNLQGIVIYYRGANYLEPTSSWSSRFGSENKPLIELITDEIASMYSRPKQLIQMSLMETASALAININANLQDDKNTYEGDTRTFCVNRGEFDVRNRAWMLDLFEIGTKEPVTEEGGAGSVTVDSTIITVDSTLITSDQT